MNRFIKRFDSKNKEEEIKAAAKQWEDAVELKDSHGKDKATKKLVALVGKEIPLDLINRQRDAINARKDIKLYVDSLKEFWEFKEFLETKGIGEITETYGPEVEFTKEQFVRRLTVFSDTYETLKATLKAYYILDIDIQRPSFDSKLVEYIPVEHMDGTLTGAGLHIMFEEELPKVRIRFDSFFDDFRMHEKTGWLPAESIALALDMLTEVIKRKEWSPF